MLQIHSEGQTTKAGNLNKVPIRNEKSINPCKLLIMFTKRKH
jgi:hypothetical protein